MKKTLIGSFLLATTLLSGLITNNALAQTTPRTGIKAGLNASTLFVDNVDNRRERFGFHVGVFTQIPVTEFFAIQPELQYTGKGVSYDILNNNKASLRLNYAELPVLATFKLGNAVDLQVGPYASYLINSKYSTEGNISLNGDFDRDNFNKLDYGLAGGLNVYFGRALLGLRYGQGFQPIASSGAARTVLGNAKNATGQISLGVAF
ncbi:porin family protein [Tellurirhabdus bombi]|uniref:porin family protein n=1 Tax=Tellurirhabdus bombi TaxID=2907205 RepID=UPI001F17F8C4|nr:porin family protein [Tellurirhabdus bombi]